MAAVVLSGTVVGSFVPQGGIPCVVTTNQGPASLSVFSNGAVGGAGYSLSVNVRNLTLAQPFQMVEDSDSGNYVELSTADGNTIWQSVGGSVTWNPSPKSVTLSVDLGSGGTDSAPRKPVHVAGSFTCSE